MTSDPLSEALRTAVVATTNGATLDELWRAAFRVDPDLAWAPDRRSRLRRALDELADAGLVRLPSSNTKRSWDATGHPYLPARVRGPVVTRIAKVTLSVPVDLRPELATGATLEPLRPKEVDVLRRVNCYLRDRRGDAVAVPARERSLEIFDDEKALDALARGRLFRAGVLSYALLDCYPVHPPFVYQRVGGVRVALVIENHHTYASAARALQVDARGIGYLIYGAGDAFVGSVSYLADLDPVPEMVWYFGDLDHRGLRTPAGAASVAAGEGLPLPRPAHLLYEALIATDKRRSTASVVDPIELEWLDLPLRPAVARLLASGHRIPQEALGFEALQRMDRWV